MSTRRRTTRVHFAVLATLLAWLVLLMPVATAHADCSGPGDFGAASGCAPPGDASGGGGGESWPPTGVDWPPSQSDDSSGAGGAADGADGGTTSAPIVMPEGQHAPPVTVAAQPSVTSTPAVPIVAAGSPAATPAATVIVPAKTPGQ